LLADGEDLRKLPYTPQEQPRRILDRRVDGIFLSGFGQGEIGPDLFRARKRGLKALVSKRRDRLYRAGRSPDWIKVKSEAIPR
jgi:bifunctional non-homologous end joining protein LigD